MRGAGERRSCLRHILGGWGRRKHSACCLWCKAINQSTRIHDVEKEDVDGEAAVTDSTPRSGTSDGNADDRVNVTRNRCDREH